MSSARVRPLAATALVLLAIAVPLAAWHATEQRFVQREARRLRAEAAAQGEDTARRLARSLADDLERLRLAESERPYYHYQALYHDPEGASEGASVAPSPLFSGPRDERIRAYFQVNTAEGLTLPALGAAGLPPPRDLALQQEVARELEAAAGDLVRAAPGDAELSATKQVLAQRAYAINAEATQVFENVKAQRPALSPWQARRGPPVTLEVGPLAWRTIDVRGRPSLVALRRVITPDGPLVQGFLVSSWAMAHQVSAADPDATLASSPRRGAIEAAIPLDLGAPWRVSLDAGVAAGRGERAAEALESAWRLRFAAGSGVALLAGLAAVALLVWTERLAAERSRFAAAAAHELRTPLAGLRLHAEMLVEGLGDKARARDYARRIADESERLGRVVGNVLAFTRLERGRPGVRPSRGDVAEVVRACVARVRPAVEAAGARLVLDVADGGTTATFDAEAVDEILVNLLDNAERHARAASDRTIEVRVSAGERAVAIGVRDHGPGVPAPQRRRLFRPFARGAGETAGGLGLGLSLSRQLARAMGGDLAFEDAEGGGSRFVLTLAR